MASGDHFELVMSGACLGEEYRNVLHYVQTAGSGGTTELIAQFDTDVQTAWEALTTIATNVTQLESINLDDTSDFDTSSVAWVGALGTVDDTTFPPWVCMTLKKVRQDRSFRSGYIRIPGVQEGSVDGYTASAGLITAANTLGSALLGPISDGSGNSWDLVIRSLPNKKFPTTRYGSISSVAFSHIGSQNSRKPY